jgi:hypothetical protein
MDGVFEEGERSALVIPTVITTAMVTFRALWNIVSPDGQTDDEGGKRPTVTHTLYKRDPFDDIHTGVHAAKIAVGGSRLPMPTIPRMGSPTCDSLVQQCCLGCS